jgi:hypothetical protein
MKKLNKKYYESMTKRSDKKPEDFVNLVEFAALSVDSNCQQENQMLQRSLVCGKSIQQFRKIITPDVSEVKGFPALFPPETVKAVFMLSTHKRERKGREKSDREKILAKISTFSTIRFSRELSSAAEVKSKRSQVNKINFLLQLVAFECIKTHK